MDYEALKNLDAAQTAALDPTAAAAALNAKTLTRVVERMTTSRGLYAALGPTVAETILQKLEGAAQAEGPYQAVLARAVGWLNAYAGGIDLGDAYTRAMLDTLQLAGVLTTAEVDALKALAVVPASRAELAGLGDVTPGDVIHARSL